MAESQDNAFEALLKPIQDLTRNWDVDLSLHLEEYIQYIRQICGDNIPDMNFAQAAVLVQNSANIYSKKVDLLFTTVLKLLDVLSKKQNNRKTKDGEDGVPEEEGGGQTTGKRRKAAAILETQEFLALDEIGSDRKLSLDLEKEKQKITERKKQKIVLNAAIKVKAKEKTSCNVYNCGQDIMGKKEEFRLNWRICSAGTLHEEFVINRSRFQILEPVEISAPPHEDVPPADESHHDYDDHCSNHSGDAGPPASPPGEEPLPLNTSHFPIVADRESEDRAVGEARKEVLKVVNAIDPNDWQPNDFNSQIPEKTIKKRKVVKKPPGLDDEKKRKSFGENLIQSNYTVSDVLFDKYKDISYNRDLDFSYHSKQAGRLKRQLLIKHRSKYQAYYEREAGIDQMDDFHGFYNEDVDSDNEHDFVGFGDANDGNCTDVDIPLPNNENILDTHAKEGWKEDDLNTYDNEAMRTMQAFRSRKIDHGKKTDMARRVEEWHQKILPKLEAAEQRSSFDIHGYGSKVLDAFQGQIDCEKSFQEIVLGQPREEVARYFLATLVLANQYNVGISESEPGDLNVDCVQLKLLSEVRHHEKLDDKLRQTSDKGGS